MSKSRSRFRVGTKVGLWRNPDFTGLGTTAFTTPTVEYLVIAGGGGGGSSGANYCGGGGAGGYRSSVYGEFSGGVTNAEAVLFISPGVGITVTVVIAELAGAQGPLKITAL